MDRYRAGMQRAIECAQMGAGQTGANPLVGAAIVRADGRIVAEGFHAGAEHAEVLALRGYANVDAQADDVLIVTLEPCNHHGKTPPCVNAIIESGIKTVIYAVADPNPIAAGGAQALKDAGITVHQGLLEHEAAWMNRAWHTRIALNRPYYTWKVAMTVDGRTSAPDYSSQWITGAESRAHVAKLRRQSDAILVGTETVLRDNPSLLPNDGQNLRPPLRVVVGEREISSDFKVHNESAPTYFHTSHDLNLLHTELLNRGVTRVLVESGSELGSAMITAGCIDELIVFIAPSLLGAGHTFFNDSTIATLVEKRELRLIDQQRFGDDIALHYAVTATQLPALYPVPLTQKAGI